MARLTSMQALELRERITSRLQQAPEDGYSNAELANLLGWQSSQSSHKNIRRFLEQMRASGHVVAIKDRVIFGAGKTMPDGTHQIKWKLGGYRKPESPDLDAIMLVIAQKASKYFLTPQQRELVDARYKERSKFDRRVEDQKRWQEKILVQARYPAIYPNIGNQSEYEEKEKIIYAALQKGTAFSGRDNFKDLQEIFFPLLLVRREQVQYVLCYKQSDKSIKHYAINRLAGVKEATDLLKNKPIISTDLADYSKVKKGSIFTLYDEMKIKISGHAAEHFTSMQFHEVAPEKTIVEVELNDHNSVISSTLTIKDIEYTYDFKCWLLGFGGNASVISPKSLRDDMIKEIDNMRDVYKTANH